MLITLEEAYTQGLGILFFLFSPVCECVFVCVCVGVHTHWHLVTCPNFCVQISPITTSWEGPQ